MPTFACLQPDKRRARILAAPLCPRQNPQSPLVPLEEAVFQSTSRTRKGRARMRRLLGVVSVLVLVAAGESGAQELRVGPVFNRSDHPLIENPTGIGVSAGIPVHPRIGFRVGYQLSRDRFRSFGSTCVGLTLPEMEDKCAAEDRREASRYAVLMLSVPITVLSSGRVDLAVVPGYHCASLESDQTGLRSDRTRSAAKDMSGFGIGAEVRLRPWRWRQLHVVLGVHRTRLDRYEDGRQVDGYSPFEEDVSVTSIEVGVSYRR